MTHNYEIGIDDYGDVYDIVIRDNSNIIAVLSSGEGPAQHLVKAGNCFDELLEALKNLIDQAQEDTPIDSRTAHFETAMDDAFAAIAKAEGK